MARNVPTSMTQGWTNYNKVGARRPVVRATIQRHHLMRFEYDTAWAQGGTFDHDRHRKGHFSSMIFGDNTPYREIENIKSCEWERTVDQDAATCSLTFVNAEIVPLGTMPPNDEDFERPGFYTYNRGETATAQSRWGFLPNSGWNGVFVPDALVKTYEGYGADPSKSPPTDPFLVQTGVWMVDKVTYGEDGTVTLEMRDLARLLLDQVVFPPAVPGAEYPLSWIKNHSENVTSRDCVGGHWKDRLTRVGRASSSNDFYVGLGLTNPPFARYVDGDGGADGHTARNVIVNHPQPVDGDSPAEAQRKRDQDDRTFWRSTGQDAQGDFVWWQFDVSGSDRMPVGAIRIRTAGGPARCYISIHNGTKWVGKREIPYARNGIAGSPGNVNIHADVPFVKSVIADRYWAFDVTLPRVYNASKIRLTFTRLNKQDEALHPYRMGLREIMAYTSGNMDNLSFAQGDVLKVIGSYGDFTHIIKWVCAWAGWYWPDHSTQLDFIRVQSGNDMTATKNWLSYDNFDPTMPKNGRVWGDFMKTGTAGIADLTVDQFDKKPMMDIINYVRDLIGFLFFIDEAGGVVWRLPNTWSLGNYMSPDDYTDGRPGKRGRLGRTSEIITLDEETNLLSYSTVLDSTSIRERIFVANVVGGKGTVIKGFNPYRIGLVRVAGWTDQNFQSKQECIVMADMISANQMFTYRMSQATIPGYPKIQTDDQIRIFERTTSETYYHYVMGIKSTLNMEDGTWTYDLQTHWLGENPSDAWVVDVDELSNVTRVYMAAVGYTAHDSEDADWEPGPGSS